MSGYTREQTEALLPAIWDGMYAWGMKAERSAPQDMPKGATPKNAAHTLWAMLADIRIAWERTLLTRQERRALYCIGGLDMTHLEAARVLDAPRQTVSERYGRGVSKLMAQLNGTPVEDVDLTWGAAA